MEKSLDNISVGKERQVDDVVEKGRRIVFNFENEKYLFLFDSLKVKDITPDECRELLNRVPAMGAYWRAVMADVDRSIATKESDHGMWMAEQSIMARQEIGDKATESKVKSTIIFNNITEIKTYEAEIIQLRSTRDYVDGIVRSIDICSRTLVSILSSMRAELDALKRI